MLFCLQTLVHLLLSLAHGQSVRSAVPAAQVRIRPSQPGNVPVVMRSQCHTVQNPLAQIVSDNYAELRGR